MATKLRRLRVGPKLRLGSTLLLSLLALLGASAAPAAAADLNAAVRTAQSVFPSVTQRCGLVGIEIGPLSSLNIGASAESYFSSCRVRVAPSTMNTASDIQLCSLMVHEFGHLAGLGHSTDPNNFMHPSVRPNPVCGATSASPAQVAESARQVRRETIQDGLTELRDELRKAKKARRRARGAKRARLTRRVKRIERRIKRLRAELRTL